MLVFLAPDCVAKWVRPVVGTNPFCALPGAKNPAHKSWKLLKNHSLTAVLLVVATTTVAFTSAKNDLPFSPPENAVGKFNPGAAPTIFVNRLVKTFKEGGNIAVFNIVQLDNGWHLLRKGTLAGNKRTEIIPVGLVNGFFLFDGPTWYSICASNQCDFYCNPNSANNACFCTPGEEPCTFGSDVGQLFEVEILY